MRGSRCIVAGWQFWNIGLKEGQGGANKMRREGVSLRIDASRHNVSTPHHIVEKRRGEERKRRGREEEEGVFTG